MKNLKKWSFLLLAVLLAMIISCKQSANGTVVGTDKKPLTINILSNDDISFAGRSASRTIMANSFKTTDTLYFYLWGSAPGTTLSPKSLTVTPDATDSAKGTVVLDIDCYNWSLTLAACQTANLTTEADILADAVLIGYGNVDMMFTNSINFTLSPKGLTKPGYVNLSIKLESGTIIPAGYSVKANIYNKITGEPIKTTGNASLEKQLMAANTSSTTDAATFGTQTYSVVEADSDSIAPGTYLFQVEFEKTDELRKFVWHDNIIILPGREATKTITIPNKIGTKPNAPTALTVAFNSGEEETVTKGKYPVTITWNQDNVDNELYFALQIAELADELPNTINLANINTETEFNKVWDTASNYKDKWEFNYLNDIRKDLRFFKQGSLFSNNTSVQIYLELGKRYIIRMYSENNAGYSDAAYVSTITPVETGATLTTVNRFKVTYNNQGGTWTNTSTNATSTAKKIEYWSQSDKPYVVINPAAASPAYTLTKNPATFIYWKKSMAGEFWSTYNQQTGAYNPDNYTDYKNLNLYAGYSRQAGIEIIDYNDYDIVPEYVSGFGIAAPNIDKESTLIYHVGNNTTASVSLTLPTGTGTNPPTWTYDNVSLQITYSGVIFYDEEATGAPRGAGNTFNIPLDTLPHGYRYDCFLEAQYNMITVSYPFTIDLRD